MPSPAPVWCGPSTANGSPWRAPTMAATSASLACHGGAPVMPPPPCHLSSTLGGQLYVPDIIAIFANRPVGREPADPSRIVDTRAPPGRLIPPLRIDPPLRRGVRVEVGGDQEVIVVCKHIHQITEAVRLGR